MSTEVLGDLTNNPYLQDLFQNLITGEITWLTALFSLLIATITGLIGGAIGGMLLASKDLGYSLATTIGGLFGLAGVIPAVAIGLVVLKLVFVCMAHVSTGMGFF